MEILLGLFLVCHCCPEFGRFGMEGALEFGKYLPLSSRSNAFSYSLNRKTSSSNSVLNYVK